MDCGFIEKGPEFANLQANILVPHRKPFQWFLFFQFNPGQDLNGLRSRLAEWAVHSSLGLTSAKDQFEVHSPQKKVVSSIFFSGHGLKKIQNSNLKPWEDLNFQAGMKDSFVRAKLGDPPLENWEAPYRLDADFLISLAADSEDQLEERSTQLTSFFQDRETAQLLFTEKAEQMYRNAYEIEPFGYRDNLSQPVLWDKNGNLKKENLPLVFDRYWGSYLVFRKLEQDVPLFEQEVERLSTQLGISKPLAEAQIMGRFKDGTPLAIFDRPIMENGSPDEKRLVDQFNYFDREDDKALGYQDDPKGIKCPFHAHIRKANPRALEEINDPQYVNFKFRGQILRRSISYNQDGKQGLFFMCFQRSIRFQFEMIQKFWCNNPEFPKTNKLKGVDPIAGQDTYDNYWNQGWGDKTLAQIPFNMARFVYFRGGEFFYAPAISYFTN